LLDELLERASLSRGGSFRFTEEGLGNFERRFHKAAMSPIFMGESKWFDHLIQICSLRDFVTFCLNCLLPLVLQRTRSDGQAFKLVPQKGLKEEAKKTRDTNDANYHESSQEFSSNVSLNSCKLVKLVCSRAPPACAPTRWPLRSHLLVRKPWN